MILELVQEGLPHRALRFPTVPPSGPETRSFLIHYDLEFVPRTFTPFCLLRQFLKVWTELYHPLNLERSTLSLFSTHARRKAFPTSQ